MRRYGGRRAFDVHMPADEISLELKRLQNNCSDMLDRYVEVARVTCEMVCTQHELPVAEGRRLAIYLQRKREDEALAVHVQATRELLTALGIQPAPPISQPAPQPVPSDKFRN